MGPAGQAGSPGPAGMPGASVVGVSIAAGDLNCPQGGAKYTVGGVTSYVCNGATGAQGPQGNTGATGLTGAQGLQGSTGPAGPQGSQGLSVTATALVSGDANCPAGGSAFAIGGGTTNYACNGQSPTGANLPGGSPATAGASCAALLAAGMTISGTYYVKNPAPVGGATAGEVALVYCDQQTNGGGWILVYNSIIGANTLDFWNILYAARFTRRGLPVLQSNFYDGSLYQNQPGTSAIYMDVIEDLQGKAVLAMSATATGMDPITMKFASPSFASGDNSIYVDEFASGWSSPDYKGDLNSTNCSTYYNNVTQHYSNCWAYSLGSDADLSGGDTTDQRLGPHLASNTASSLSLFADASSYTRVRRISRFVKW